MPDATPKPEPFVKLSLSSPPLTGDNVKEAQRALKDNRFGDFHPGKTDGRYSDHTAAAARRAKYWLGFRKRTWRGAERFDYGHKLHRTLIGERKLTLMQRRRRVHRLARAEKNLGGLAALHLAKTQVGTHESPAESNLQKYGKWYGDNGVPWCAIFISWCFDHSQSWTQFRKIQFRYAFVPFVVGDARAGRRGLSVVPAAGARPGDLACFDWPGESPGTADHIGFVASKVVSGVFQTIEGNTSAGSNSNGGQVQARTRNVSDVQVFVRVNPI